MNKETVHFGSTVFIFDPNKMVFLTFGVVCSVCLEQRMRIFSAFAQFIRDFIPLHECIMLPKCLNNL